MRSVFVECLLVYIKNIMSRSFQFTWFFKIEKSEVKAYLESKMPTMICWLGGGFEKCPKTNNNHLQGCFMTDRNITLSIARQLMKTLTGDKPHIEVVKKQIAMDKYNEKDGDTFEIGNRSVINPDAEFDEAAALVLAGKTQDVKKAMLIKYPTGLASLKKIFYKPAKNLDILPGRKVGIWIHGAPETGKSYMARNLFPDKTLYLKSKDALWDYYANEEVVLIDDVTKDTMRWMHEKLLDWADRTAFPAKMLYLGSPIIRPRFVIITSNYSLEEIYPYHDMSVKYKAMRRRFADYNADTSVWSHLISEATELPKIPVVPDLLK